MINTAIQNAKAHNINLHRGISNQADGNCIFECCLNSINYLEYFQGSYKGSPDFLAIKMDDRS